MKKVFCVLAFFVVVLGEASAQIVMFKGSFDDAMKKARQEKKELFVDFYATWCGPCKMMEAEVFSRPEVGDYFNSRFVCVQVDGDVAENKELLKTYGVKAYPTMVFINREGKELRKIEGVVPPVVLIKEAKIAVGEQLSFEKLYEKFKKNKKDCETQQQLLFEAPAFYAGLQGYEREKWTARVKSLFPDYLKAKKIENMINEADFQILSMYHGQTSKQDPVFDYVATHFDEFAQAVGREKVAAYLIGLNNSYIIQLCKKGDLSYKDRLGRVNGDLSKAYSGITFGSLSVLEAITLLSDATYYLYKHDEAKFFEYMDKYLNGKGNQANLDDYTQALENLSIAYNGKLSATAYAKSIEWATKALEKDMDPVLRTRILIILGQCFQNTDNKERAKQCLNQAFLASAQIADKREMKYFQEMIQKNLSEL